MIALIIAIVVFGLVLLDDLYYMHEVNKERLITTEAEEMEKDYVYMNDGTAVEFNEDDQE